MATYGRHRQSIADIENELNNIFNDHPESFINDAGEPVIPADSLVDVFRAFSDVYNGVELLSEDEMAMLKLLLASNTGLQVTPQILLQFIAEKTKSSPPRSPGSEEEGRGRSEEWVSVPTSAHRRRSSSSGSDWHPSSSNRSPSKGPQTPLGKSPFDTERRQRSTPLGNGAAPSSWNKRPAPAHRRKSDAGSRSDSESWSASPSAFNRTGSRSRAPSNPTSPSTTLADLSGSFSPIGSPNLGGTFSRPHSRAHSQPQSGFNGSFSAYNSFASPTRDGYSSPDDNNHTINSSDAYKFDESFMGTLNSLPMPTSGSTSDDEDAEGYDDGYVHDPRTAASSTASMEPGERLEALQKANRDLSRKLIEAERTLGHKLSEHELELEEAQGRLEETRAELGATKREEKELRSKERQNMTQIAALELEVSKLTKALEHARSTYSSLQKQYQEQCAVSEKYRDDLRQREELIRTLREAGSLHEVETAKWAKEHEGYEERLAALEAELSVAQHAHAQLDEQKQENLLLKETIDRMRFDMDEMRNSAATNLAGGGAGSGRSSAANTLSKSLGAELLGKMNTPWGMEDEEGAEPEDEEGSETTAVDPEDEDTEGEDVIQTIITRKKRKVASRANKIETRTFEEVKEYSDSSTQYDPTLFCVSHASQTDPEPQIKKLSFSVQTQDTPTRIFAVQTDPEPIPPPRVTIEMEIQTDEVEEEVSRSPSPQHDESLASSSSTIIPPTPKAHPVQLGNLDTLHADQPPAYNQINPQEQEEREWRIAAETLETLKKWHHGVKIPFEPVPGGVSEEMAEEWKALKEELGVDCLVIDKIIETSEKAGPSRSPKDAKLTRRGRFYNIYNTYVYGDKSTTTSSLSALAGHTVVFVGVTALAMLAISPYVAPQYNIPGGPTYYDRSAWNSFNTMQAAGEGFAPDGTAAVWSFLGRVGGGAARMARGWPT